MTKLEIGKEYWIKAKFLGEPLEAPASGPEIPRFRYGFRIGNRKGFVDFSVGDFEALEASPVHEKVTIPKEAADFISGQKNFGHGVLEALEEASLLTKLDVIDWLKPVENQEKFLKAWLYGYAVKEPLGVLLVDMPENTYWKYTYLYVNEDGEYDILGADEMVDIINNVEAYKVTEAEAKEKYPNFKWVSLEELENES